MQAVTICALLLIAPAGGYQSAPGDAPGALSLSDAVGLPMARGQVFTNAMDAWQYTFGQEPGARIDKADKENGVIDGTARVNFRSTFLLDREETMGSITYHISITADNGQCLVRVSHLMHTGNHGAPGGGMDFGTILSGDGPLERVQGMHATLAKRIHAEIRDKASGRIGEVMQAFTARLRRGGQH